MSHRIAFITSCLALFLFALPASLAHAQDDDDAAPDDASADADAAPAPLGTCELGDATADTDEDEDRRSRRKARREARKQVQLGNKLGSQQRYDEAITAFCEAYKLDQQPETLYNLGTAARLGGKARDAKRYYERYLSVQPDGRLADSVKKSLVDLDAEIAEEDRRLAKIQSLEKERDQAKAERDELKVEVEAVREALEEAETELQTMRESAAAGGTSGTSQKTVVVAGSSGRGSTKRLIGTSLMALGGVALGLAVKSGLDASSANSELDSLGTEDAWGQGYQWLHDHGQTSQTRMIIFSISGAVLVGGGVTLYYLGMRDDKRPAKESAVSIVPALGPESAGVQVSGHF